MPACTNCENDCPRRKSFTCDGCNSGFLLCEECYENSDTCQQCIEEYEDAERGIDFVIPFSDKFISSFVEACDTISNLNASVIFDRICETCLERSWLIPSDHRFVAYIKFIIKRHQNRARYIAIVVSLLIILKSKILKDL